MKISLILFSALIQITSGTRGALHGLKGNQLPPPDTAYSKYYDTCGMRNCQSTDRWNNLKCLHKRRKRSLRLQTRKFNATIGDDYIKGGSDIPDFEYPWLGKLDFFQDLVLNDWVTLCTVTLISSRHVLTARHCFFTTIPQMSEYGKTYDYKKIEETVHTGAKRLRVFFGSQKLQGTGEEIIAHVEKVYIPPKHLSSDHDIAIIEIREVEFTTELRPICLPIYGMALKTAPYTSSSGVPHTVLEGAAAGFGHTGWYEDKDGNVKPEEADFPQELDSVAVTAAGAKEPPAKTLGQFTFKGASDVRETSHFIATLPKGGEALCLRDSGGPFMWTHPDTGRYHILGVFSGTDAHCVKSLEEDDSENVYTKVHIFLKRIFDFMTRDNEKYCLHPDCVTSKHNELSRTWIMDVQTFGPGGDFGHEITRLAAPCQEVPEFTERVKVKHICPVGLSTNRSWIIIPEVGLHTNLHLNSFQRWRYCLPLSKCKSAGFKSNYDSYLYIDELTAGSLIQTRYAGFESQFDELVDNKFNDMINKRKNVPYTDLCHLAEKYEGKNKDDNILLKCPKLGGSGHRCILPERNPDFAGRDLNSKPTS